MQSASAPTLHPASLSPGTVVGPWRVVAWVGRGVYGAVFRAVPVDTGPAAPVALKLALRPGDPRFAREVELLSRTRHPSVPRLVGSGAWQHPDGTRYPYIAMEWVEGVPLYDWARQGARSPEQVLEVLAQLAGALADLHAQGGVHRDVKGDNVLVRHSDGRAMLLDFGMGHHAGAATLTPPGVYPGTPVYRSPEAGQFELRFFRDPAARYCAGPADDVYALGVTACQLVTGEYPEFADPWKNEHGTWNLGAVLPPAALLRIEPRLREWILRMLSVSPEERGTAAQLAEALEQAARPAAPKSPAPPPAEAPSATRTPSRSVASRERPTARERARPWLAVVAMVLALTGWVGWLVSAEPVKQPIASRAVAMKSGQRDAGTAGLGDAAATTSMNEPPGALSQEVVAEDSLPEPLPGQAVPDAKGRCPHKQQVSLNGGCWGLISKEPEACETLGGQMYQGTCYIPIIEHPHGRPRPRTSGPTRKSPSR
ncbi:MAG: serine/threonine-protein kinase [Hyalangium sp.]|uniref:serine/threonine-protein kinase n=1 Tax=Hyalangium sp. TaxID=2028555 RepID=UPI00389A2DF4